MPEGCFRADVDVITGRTDRSLKSMYSASRLFDSGLKYFYGRKALGFRGPGSTVPFLPGNHETEADRLKATETSQLACYRLRC